MGASIAAEKAPPDLGNFWHGLTVSSLRLLLFLFPSRRPESISSILKLGTRACVASCLSLWIRVGLVSSEDSTWYIINVYMLA